MAAETKAEKEHAVAALSPEEKAAKELAEKNVKEAEERTKAIDKATKELLKVEEKHGVETGTILKEMVERIKAVATVAAGAVMGPSPAEVAELMEKHTPYIIPFEARHENNIVFHAPYLETTEPSARTPAEHGVRK